MNNKIKNVCVYCSSSNSLEDIYYKDAENLGVLLAKNNYNVVYGGSKLGLMYKVAKRAKHNGSKLIGVMPAKLYDLGVSEAFCDEFYLTKEMRERKATLDEKSDAVIALAGGFGTLEELSEMIVQKQLCYNNKAIVILNTNGFYNDLLNFFEKIISKKFAAKDSKNLYYVANSPDEVIKYLNSYKFDDTKSQKEELIHNVLSK